MLTTDTFVKCCADGVRSMFSTALGGEWDVQTAETNQNDSAALVLPFHATGALSGRLDIVVTKPDALALVHIFTGDGDSSREWDDTQDREAIDELVRQIAGELATRLRPYCGELSLKYQPEAKPSQAAVEHCLVAETAAAKIRLWIRLDAELSKWMQSTQFGANDAEISSPPVRQSAQGQQLDLLMGVELPAVLRFGQRRMALREVLELNVGAVVELDRMVQEPVELLLDGRVIANGEVVIIDGCYGLRVTSIPSQR